MTPPISELTAILRDVPTKDLLVEIARREDARDMSDEEIGAAFKDSLESAKKTDYTSLVEGKEKIAIIKL